MWDRNFTLDDIPHRFDWRMVQVLREGARPGSAVYQLREGEAASWSWDTWLLADIRDLLRWLQWAGSTAPQDHIPPPRPGYRPIKPDEDSGESTRFGDADAAMELPDLDRYIRENFMNAPPEVPVAESVGVI